MPIIRTITELTACGLAVALSPLDIALVFLLLLGATPFLRSGLFSLAWFFSNSAAIALLLTVGRYGCGKASTGGATRCPSPWWRG